MQGALKMLSELEGVKEGERGMYFLIVQGRRGLASAHGPPAAG